MFLGENRMEMARTPSAQTQRYMDFKSRLAEHLHETELTSDAKRLREQKQEARRAALDRALDFTEQCMCEQQLNSLDTPEKNTQMDLGFSFQNLV
ncbi:uncharacterized protein Z519_07445 [Cladophialophora bantiana CBS 173.52]|uniref:Uncharacterized protein n=1 Tax=Cladophialophora bantiana (strain ATCC 10958 / CBS 173.52 / CDC B-1940 / NIH 8579) TaxID=1442370 RepID=A0A0D2I3L8_CLAB1|nr:uncharacterized protein Z519_07445 [Cladophialophora bantiana CBS 173.52]KIW91479.1 hypothetical protein Z519_07445 [Cladophialophora bantiana CBS 173.52]